VKIGYPEGKNILLLGTLSIYNGFDELVQFITIQIWDKSTRLVILSVQNSVICSYQMGLLKSFILTVKFLLS